MNDLLAIRDRVARNIPNLKLVVHEPLQTATGIWSLEIGRWAAPPIDVEWAPGLGFGLFSSEEDGYCFGCDEVYPDIESAYQRIAELLAAGGRTRSLEERMAADRSTTEATRNELTPSDTP